MRRKKGKLIDRRYDSIRKRLGLSIGKKAKRKFIIIQIDSLPYEVLDRFFEKGSCKFMHSLIEKKGYHFQKWNCGVPSGTPHVQAGIMYGENSMIPGFRFMDKKNRKNISFGNPQNVRYMEENCFSGKKGILEDGASYANHWSWGASHSILTMSTITKTKRIRRIKEWELWLFLFLHPGSVMRVWYYSFAEFLIEIGEALVHPFVKLFRPKRAIFGFWIPFRRMLMHAIGAELITIGVITDIKRNMPRIFVNLMNYDDVAHLRGPNSTAAYFALRAADRRIKRICRKAEDKYDIFIISDHGMVDAMTFRSLNRMTLAEYIEKCARVDSFQLSSAFEGRLTLIGSMMRNTMDFVKYMSTPVRWIGTAFAKAMIRMMKPKRYRFVWDENERIYVLDSCCLAGVYFSISKERMEKREIEKRYPDLIARLLKNKGIGIVMVKDRDNTILEARDGRITLTPTGVKREGKDFLKQYGDEDILLKQLREYSDMKYVADLVLFGNYVDGLMVSFTDHVGAHGGIGGNMTWPFMISKKKYDFSKVTNARELYRIFKNY